VLDASGQTLIYVYARETPNEANIAGVLRLTSLETGLSINDCWVSFEAAALLVTRWRQQRWQDVIKAVTSSVMDTGATETLRYSGTLGVGFGDHSKHTATL